MLTVYVMPALTWLFTFIPRTSFPGWMRVPTDRPQPSAYVISINLQRPRIASAPPPIAPPALSHGPLWCRDAGDRHRRSALRGAPWKRWVHGVLQGRHSLSAECRQTRWSTADGCSAGEGLGKGGLGKRRESAKRQ